MNFSGLGGAMSAVPGGYMAGMGEMQHLQHGDLALKDQQAKQIGMQAYFKALSAMGVPAPGQGPQAPMPGQPSVPMQQPQAPQQPQVIGQGGAPARPDAQGVYGQDAVMLPPQPPVMAQGGGPPGPPGSPGAPAYNSPPGGPAAGGGMTWQGIAQMLKQQNPEVSDLALAHAVDKFMPLMNQQSQQEWRNARMELQQYAIDTRAQSQQENRQLRDELTRFKEERADRRHGETQDRIRETHADRMELARQREERLERGLALRKDTTWAKLDQQKQALFERVRQGDKRIALSEARAVIDAQHKRAMEILQANSINNTMNKTTRDEMVRTQNEWYNGEIEKLRSFATQRGNLSDNPPPTGIEVTDEPVAAPKPGVSRPRVGAATPQTAITLPPAAVQALKEGVVTTFQNGQKWTLEGGQPKQVQ